MAARETRALFAGLETKIRRAEPVPLHAVLSSFQTRDGRPIRQPTAPPFNLAPMTY
jgi:hypothetical protein